MAFKVFNVRCQNCGASIFFDPIIRVSRCNYCGSINLIERIDAPDSRFSDVDGILTASIDEMKSKQILRHYLCSSAMVPDDVLDLFTDFKNYLSFCPVYIYEVDYKANWSADVGYFEWEEKEYYDVNERRWKRKKEQKTKYQPANGAVDGAIELYAPASSSLQNEPLSQYIVEIARNLLRRGYSKFSIEELSNASWLAFDSYDKESFNTFCSAILNKHIESKCNKMVSGDTYKNFCFSYKYSYKVKKVLIPVWFYTFNYMGKDYTILIDAMKGVAYGNPPISKKRIAYNLILFSTPIVLTLLFSFITDNWTPLKDILTTLNVILSSIIYYVAILITAFVLPFVFNLYIANYKKKFPDLTPEERAKSINHIKNYEKTYLIFSLLFVSLTLISIFFSQESIKPPTYLEQSEVKKNNYVEVELEVKGIKDGHIGILFDDKIVLYNEILKNNILESGQNSLTKKIEIVKDSFSITVSVYNSAGKLILNSKKNVDFGFSADKKLQINIDGTSKKIIIN